MGETVPEVLFYFFPTEVWRVRVDEARDRLQTKTKHYNLIFSSVSLRTAEVFPRSSPLRDSRGATSALNTVLF